MKLFHEVMSAYHVWLFSRGQLALEWNCTHEASRQILLIAMAYGVAKSGLLEVCDHS